MLHLSDFDFPLPKHLIAQHPLRNRTDSRLLVMTKDMDSPRHETFKNLIDYLNPGDVLVLNNTKVFPARLYGHKIPTGGRVEILLSRILPMGDWVALIASKRRLLSKSQICLKNNGGHFSQNIIATIVNKIDDEPGAYHIAFNDDITPYLEKIGQIPLPRYIERNFNEIDVERYQTVFADPTQNQAAAAPTAGMHFDKEFLSQIEHKGVHIAYVTLHVGPGTFLPLRTDRLDEHKMHAEPWFINDNAANTINHVKAHGGKVVAVGTTAVRALESAALTLSPNTIYLMPGQGLTKLFIRPGFPFRIVDRLVTNFHLPKTTLLLLVAAAMGSERMLAAYREAVQHEYRFFSYGDACLFDVVDEYRLRVST